MPTGRGQKCPECGHLTFYSPHAKTGARKCTQCEAEGWHNNAKPKAAGRGDMCRICSSNTYRIVATMNGVTVKYCSTCEATAFSLK
jgi:hypothetical protein